jgi:hypothetical protein
MAIAVSAVALGAAQRRATTTVPPQALGSVTAKCKQGQVALAAGFDAPGFNPNTTNGPVARLDSMPAGKRGIKTAGFNFNQTDPGEARIPCLQRQACAPPLIRSKRVQVTPNSFAPS